MERSDCHDTAPRESKIAAWSRKARAWKIEPALLIGLGFLLVVTTCALFAPYLAPMDPLKQSLRDRLAPPVWMDETSKFILGADGLGRDVVSRIIYGARASLGIGLSATILSALFGIPVGLLAGYYRGVLDTLLMRLADILLTLPGVLLALCLLAVLGASTVNLVLVLSLSQWIVWVRLIRGETLALRIRDYVQSARSLGASDLWTLRHHILPNIVGVIIVQFSVSLTRVILQEASLSFLGFGVQPPTPSWGTMLDSGRDYLGSAWWVATFPGLAIALTVVGVNLTGDWLRDRLDPKLRF